MLVGGGTPVRGRGTAVGGTTCGVLLEASVGGTPVRGDACPGGRLSAARRGAPEGRVSSSN